MSDTSKTTHLFKPNITFLRKIAAGKVGQQCSYSRKNGASWSFFGGEKTLKAHAAAGYCTMPRCPGVMCANRAELTEMGRATLAKATGEETKP